MFKHNSKVGEQLEVAKTSIPEGPRRKVQPNKARSLWKPMASLPSVAPFGRANQ